MCSIRLPMSPYVRGCYIIIPPCHIGTLFDENEGRKVKNGERTATLSAEMPCTRMKAYPLLFFECIRLRVPHLRFILLTEHKRIPLSVCHPNGRFTYRHFTKICPFRRRFPIKVKPYPAPKALQTGQNYRLSMHEQPFFHSKTSRYLWKAIPLVRKKLPDFLPLKRKSGIFACKVPFPSCRTFPQKHTRLLSERNQSSHFFRHHAKQRPGNT